MDEIRAALFSVDSGKSLGPDGYTAHFFEDAWSIAGGMTSWQLPSISSVSTSRLRREVNSTIVTLVPKMEGR